MLTSCSGAHSTTAPPTTVSTVPVTTSTTLAVLPGKLPDGRYQVRMKRVDVAGRTIYVDLVQILTGDAAARAYHVEHPEDPDGPPNDYYVINQEEDAWRVPVAAGAKITVQHYNGATYEERPGELADVDDGGKGWNIHMVVRDGAVVELHEHYRP
jgi:hypothetical protein